MAVKSGYDQFLEKIDARKKLDEIDDKIRNLANLVSNQDFDERFDMAVVEFKMFLEKIQNETLKDLVKSLHNESFGHDFYSANNGQDSYVLRLRRIYDSYIKNNISPVKKEENVKKEDVTAQILSGQKKQTSKLNEQERKAWADLNRLLAEYNAAYYGRKDENTWPEREFVTLKAAFEMYLNNKIIYVSPEDTTKLKICLYGIEEHHQNKMIHDGVINDMKKMFKNLSGSEQDFNAEIFYNGGRE